ncbi:UNVERIFIED_CONTAM: hypothetical protein Sradi_4889800 [Sesamum radiatum]|uniref:Uncharacterized protein n=1 Tax=Sesamum radiatum TaxID=300843 RepID=A0AAW2MET2_SESRA
MIEPIGEGNRTIVTRGFTREVHENGEVSLVDKPICYNIILGRPSLNLFRAVASTFHMKLKLPTLDGVGEAVGDERLERECYANTLKRSREKLDVMSDQKGKRKMTDMKHEIRHTLEEPLEKTIWERRVEIVEQLKEVFAWTMTDLHGISPDIITQRLSVNPNAKPVKQKKRMFGVERSQAIKEEVDKLPKAKYIQSVEYPEWLANTVLVSKPNGKWDLCIEFMDLN